MDEYLLKVVVIGNMGVGKTSLLLRYTDDKFTESHISTIGVDFKMKTLERNDCLAIMQLWDTAGQDRTIVSSFYRGAEGLILVFDVTDLTSFERIPSWLEEASRHGSQDCVKLLVGNKTDLPGREVDEAKAKTLADKLGIQYIEGSAKTASNVHKVFDSMADMILEKKMMLGLPPLSGSSTDRTIKISSKDVSDSSWCSWGPSSCYSQ